MGHQFYPRTKSLSAKRNSGISGHHQRSRPFVVQAKSSVTEDFDRRRSQATRLDAGLIQSFSLQKTKLNTEKSTAGNECRPVETAPERQIMRDEWIGGRLWTTDEIAKRDLMTGYYETWAYVDDVINDGKPIIGTKDNIQMTFDATWLKAWNNYATAIDSAIKTWIGTQRQDFSPFARGSTLWTLRNIVQQAGGLLGKNQKRPGSIPLTKHPNEVAVDQFIGRAQNAYINWCNNPTLAQRGPFDGNLLTLAQLQRLQARKSYGPGWTFHPSNTGGFALHHPGPVNADIDPRTNNQATFIYHVQ